MLTETNCLEYLVWYIEKLSRVPGFVKDKQARIPALVQRQTV